MEWRQQQRWWWWVVVVELVGGNQPGRTISTRMNIKRNLASLLPRFLPPPTNQPASQVAAQERLAHHGVPLATVRQEYISFSTSKQAQRASSIFSSPLLDREFELLDPWCLCECECDRTWACECE